MPRKKRLDFLTMLTCKEVSTLVSTGGLDDALWMRKLGAVLHLAMCRHCRAFRRQMDAIGRAIRGLNARYQAEPSSGFEATVVQRLLR
jgi:hypothetical protein